MPDLARVGAFLLPISEVHGIWRKAIQVPGTAALNHGGMEGAAVTSVSCPAVGTCSTGGNYTASSGFLQAFVASKVNGTWGTAKKVPGIAALSTGPNASAMIGSVSCAAAGNCSAGGTYTDRSSDDRLFVVNQVNGTWGTAEEIPGSAALSTGRPALLTAMSCAPAGTCSAGGYYSQTNSILEAFGVSKP